MKNNINFNNANLNNGNGEVFSLADLQKPENSARLEEIRKIGDKGVSIYFKEGDLITFPIFEEAKLRVTGFETVNGKVVPLLDIMAYCDRWGYFWCPMSIFRRIPIDFKLEGQEVDDFSALQDQDKNALGILLLPKQPDYERILKVVGKTAKVTAKCKMHKPTYNNVNGTIVRNDKVLEGLTCYMFKEDDK